MIRIRQQKPKRRNSKISIVIAYGYLMIFFSAGLRGWNVPFERVLALLSLRNMTPPPYVATVLSTPEAFPWIHFSPRYAQSLITVRISGFGSDVGGGMYPNMTRRAVARLTEMDALDPSPDPIGIDERNMNVTLALMGFAREMNK